MTPVSPALLLFVRVLADRHGMPAALLAEAATPQAEPARLAPLAEHWPCFYSLGLDAPATALFTGALWQPMDPAALFGAGERLDKSQLPPEARWIDGDWYLGPPAKATGTQAASRTRALQLVQLVGADADTHEIEALLRQDPALSYHLLRLVNSLGVGAGRRVTSFAQAILILGRQQLRRWLNLMLFAAREGDVRSGMLLARVAMRARAIELLARDCGLDKHTQEQSFMVGMFSLLGILFGMPLAELLAPLAISDAVRAALLGRAGELGELLALVESGERGDFADVSARLAGLQLAAADFNAAVLDAAAWMFEVVNESQGTANG